MTDITEVRLLRAQLAEAQQALEWWSEMYGSPEDDAHPAPPIDDSAEPEPGRRTSSVKMDEFLRTKPIKCWRCPDPHCGYLITDIEYRDRRMDYPCPCCKRVKLSAFNSEMIGGPEDENGPRGLISFEDLMPGAEDERDAD